MKDDTREELERLEKELLEQEPEQEELLDDELLRTVFAEPAFEDMDQIHEPEEPMVYCNFSNGYGRDLEQSEEYEEEQPEQSKADKVNIGLMIAASVLCLGIIGVMIFWLAKYL